MLIWAMIGLIFTASPEACLLMEKYIGLVRKTNKIKEPVKKQIIRRLFLSYYARILKQYKNAQEPNPYQRDAQGNPVPPLSDKEKEFRKREIERIKRLPRSGSPQTDA